MKAIVVTDQAAGTAGMKLVKRPEPQAAINERDARGPILREGPFNKYEQAREAAERLDREANPPVAQTNNPFLER